MENVRKSNCYRIKATAKPSSMCSDGEFGNSNFQLNWISKATSSKESFLFFLVGLRAEKAWVDHSNVRDVVQRAMWRDVKYELQKNVDRVQFWVSVWAVRK